MIKRQIDYILLFAVIALVVIGLIFVYSASYYSAEITYNNKYFFVIKQAIGAAIGLVAMLIFARVKLDFIKKMQPWGITVGGALFEEGKFGGGTVAERIDRIDAYCNSL